MLDSVTQDAALDAPRDLAVVDAFRTAIDKINDPWQLKSAIGYAAAVRRALQLRGAARGAQHAWAEIKLRAERKIGAMLASVDLDKGGRPSTKTDNVRLSVRLSDLNIHPMQSSRWKREASVPEEEFEAWIANMKARDEEITSIGLRRLADSLRPPSPRRVGDQFPEVDTTCVVVEHACPNCGHVFECDGGEL